MTPNSENWGVTSMGILFIFAVYTLAIVGRFSIK